MEIRESTEDGVRVVALEGSLDAPSAAEAEDVFLRLLNEGADRVVVDLAQVEYVSSAGIRIVIMLHKGLEKRNGRLALCGLTPFVKDVFAITRLNELLAVHETRDAAVDDLAG
jgi:anti-anti-sigma factor